MVKINNPTSNKNTEKLHLLKAVSYFKPNEKVQNVLMCII